MSQPPFQKAASRDLLPFEAAVGTYRLLKWRHRHFKRRFVAISANVEFDYLFS
jgi:hypothetical protein